MACQKQFRIFYLSPGLVQYFTNDNRKQLTLIRKRCLDEMNQTFVCKPVFNETHRDVNVEASAAFDFSGGRSKNQFADGIVTAAGYDGQRGRH